MTKLNSNCDKTQKFKLWQSSNPIFFFTKLKNSNCDKTWRITVTKLKKKKTHRDRTKKKPNSEKTQRLELWWLKLKTQNVTKLKNTNCDKTKKKLWQLKNTNCDHSKTQIVTKLKKFKLWQNSKFQIVTNPYPSNCDKTPKLKLWQNLKINIVTKLQNSKGQHKKRLIA